MSSITTPSFVDDGESFIKRVRRDPLSRHAVKQLDSNASDASAYTGSFLDDGADMLNPLHKIPGFGLTNSKFYEHRGRRADNAVWNHNVQKAISGDVYRNLTKMRNLAALEVKQKDNKTEQREKTTVTVMKPPKWDTFVIKAEHGRIIIVDHDGEFDSGSIEPESKLPVRWIQAADTLAPSQTHAPVPQSPPTDSVSSQRTKQQTKEVSKRNKRNQEYAHRHKELRRKDLGLPNLKALAPITVSNHDSDSNSSGSADVVSSANFFMTGGASGWPKNDEVIHGSSGKSDSTLPVCSDPIGWLSPLQQKGKSATSSEKRDSVQNFGSTSREQNLQRSCSYQDPLHPSIGKPQKSSIHDLDNWSTKAHSLYRSPTVEDAPETSSNENWSSTDRNRGHGWSEWEHGSQSGKKEGRSQLTRMHELKDNETETRKSWKGSEEAVDHVGWASASVLSNQDRESSRRRSESSWDGFERFKTVSETSVVGSGSDCSLLRSQASSRRSGKASASDSYRSHRPKKTPSSHSSTGQAGWADSQANQESWADERAWSENRAWERSKKDEDKRARNARPSKNNNKKAEAGYANGYDEDNETYLNESWGGIPVRVGSRKMTVAGWG